MVDSNDKASDNSLSATITKTLIQLFEGLFSFVEQKIPNFFFASFFASFSFLSFLEGQKKVVKA
jgi:hypothetical protein